MACLLKRTDLVIIAALIAAALLSSALVGGESRIARLDADTSALFAPRQGFYGLEQNAAERLRYRWTDGAATLLLPNPGGQLWLDLWLLDGPSGDNWLRLSSAGQQVELTLQPGLRRYRLLLAPQVGEQFVLGLASPTVKLNDRLLGVGFSAATIAGRQVGPTAIGWMAALAALALYGFGRWTADGRRWTVDGRRQTADGGRWLALAFTLAIVAPLWHGLGGWRYGLLGEALLGLAAAVLVALGHETLCFSRSRSLTLKGRKESVSLAPLESEGLSPVRYGLGLLGVIIGLGGLLLIALPPFVAPILCGAIAFVAVSGLALLRRAGLPLLAATVLIALGLGGAAMVGPLLGPAEGQVSVFLGLLGAAALVAVFGELLPPLMSEQQEATGAGFAIGRADWGPLAFILGTSLLVRLPFLSAQDPVGDLEIAAGRMAQLYNYGLAGSYNPPGDYMPLRLYTLSGLAWLAAALGEPPSGPLTPLLTVLIKLPQLLADLLTPLLIFAWSKIWLPARRALTVAALYALAPPIWINAAWWGQVDGLLMLPMLLTIVLFERAGGRLSWACWVIALLIKPQAIILAPLVYVVTLRRYGCRGLVEGAAIGGAIATLAVLPLFLAGQFTNMLAAYSGSVGRFPRATAGAYNLWYLWLGPVAHDSDRVLGGLSARGLGFLLLGAVATLVSIGLLRCSDGLARAQAAAVLMLAFFCLPTQIHERYLFLALAPLALCIAPSERWAGLFLWAVASATLNVLAELSGFVPIIDAILGQSPLRYVIALTNLAALGFALFFFLRPPHRRA